MKQDYTKYKFQTSIEVWKKFEKKHPDCKELGLDYWTLRRILSTLGDLITEEVLTNPLGFTLPYQFGCLRMIGFPLTKRTGRIKGQKLNLSHGYI